MNNVNMANMAAMGVPVGAPMGMMNNSAVVPQPGPRPGPASNQLEMRGLLNTYIYEYFLRYEMFDCARTILNSDYLVKVHPKDGLAGRRDENGNLVGNGLGDDPMDTDSKADMDSKRPDDLPAPVVPMPSPDSCFLFDWFTLFWEMFYAQKGKGPNVHVNQYVNHTQQVRSPPPMSPPRRARHPRRHGANPLPAASTVAHEAGPAAGHAALHAPRRPVPAVPDDAGHAERRPGQHEAGQQPPADSHG